ncbi:phosphate transport system substrate-binding protein [Sphingomonas jinjuensis]|uniref:Phosphate transport system substrate-binding protein n=1 Tax=Sphingomonas jinjuensis TaxID=535907 RepID=A0A840FFM5_9SPHN|nr:substrate-binding domain-containing protein [Sphingomonas jinjuensis]MBB4152798.1 phosphate transport system substrate-binding protein [Sphingomonas jinjuensis]
MRTLVAILGLLLAGCQDQANGGGGTRDQITVVGSSTVYPFTTIVAERFVARAPSARAPVIESTGTGAGMRLFCGGIGAAYPDIVDASRRMTAGEYAACRRHGVNEVIEVPIGLDGLAFAQARGGPSLRLTPAILYRALAADPGGRVNTARTWADVDPSLPRVPIKVYGPPATSGTRDALVELILIPGCRAVEGEALVAARANPDARRAFCGRLREDGAFVDAGENDNLVVQKLGSDPTAIGMFGYSYLEENRGAVTGLPVAGVSPSYEAIARGDYPGARPLYIYVKKAHLRAVPGLRAFLRLYAASWGPGGPLVRRGLIAGSADSRARAATIVAAETPLDPRSLS